MHAEGYIPTTEELGADGYLLVAPPRQLQTKSLKKGFGVAGAADAIKRAEQALEELTPNFHLWADAESRDLVAARDAARNAAYGPSTRDFLFRKAHDLKGHAGTFGYPVAAEICASLCRLIETGLNDRNARILADHHVDAVRAIVNSNMQGECSATREIADALKEAAAKVIARCG